MRMFFAAAGVVVAVILAAFAIFALTSAGNEYLHAQLEEAFSEAFAGRLSVESVTGVPARTLTAHEISLYDAEGRLVAEADSADISLSWRSLLSNNVRIRSLTLYRPAFSLMRLKSGAWNVQEYFAGSPTSAGSARGLAIEHVRILDGTLHTSNEGSAPPLVASNWLFDYTESFALRLDVEASLQAGDEGGRLVLHKLSAALPEAGIAIRQSSGVLTFSEQGFTFSDAYIQTDHSVVTGYISSTTNNGGAPRLALSLDKSRLAFDEWKKLAPALPLAKQATVSLRAEGPINHLVIDTLRLKTAGAQLAASGSIDGLGIENQAITFSAASSVEADSPSALLAMVEDPPVTELAAGDAYVEGKVRLAGSWSNSRLRLSGNVEADALDGRLNGAFTATTMPNEPPVYSAQLQTDGVSLAQIFPRLDQPYSITGPVHIRRSSSDGAYPHVIADVGGEFLNDAGLASLQLVVTPTDETFAVTARGRQNGPGRLDATLELRRGRSVTTISGKASLRRYDAARFWPNDTLSTRLNAGITFDGDFASWGEIDASLTLDMDSSVIGYGRESHDVAASTTTVDIRTTPDNSALSVGGDVLNAELTGHFSLPALVSVSERWYERLRGSVVSTLRKPMPQTNLVAADLASYALPVFDHPLRDSIRVEGSISLVRPGVLAALWPSDAPHALETSATFELNAGPTTHHLVGALKGDSLRWNGHALADYRGRISVEARHVENRLRGRWSAEVTAEDAWVNNASVGAIELTSRYSDGRGEVNLNTGNGGSGPLQLEVGWTPYPTYNKVSIRRLSFAKDEYSWQLREPSAVNVYYNGVAIPGLSFARQGEEETGPRVALRGALSGAPADTLSITMRGLSLASLVGLIPGDHPVQGRVHGKFDYTGGLRQPALTGAARIANVRYDGHLLGDLHLESRYAADSSAMAVAVRMTPDTASMDFNGSKRPAPLRLSAHGMLRLPGLTASQRKDGALDLDVNVERADVFFLNYPPFSALVADARGFFHGNVNVTGSFQRPVFTGEFELERTSVRLPQFNLHYTANGPFTIDAEGLHFSKMNIRDDGEGVATVRGDLLFNDYDYLSFDLDADLGNLLVMNLTSAEALPFYGEIRAEGRYSLEGPFGDALLRSTNARAAGNSEIFVPLTDYDGGVDAGFIVFRDEPDTPRIPRREAPKFLKGLDMDLNVSAQRGTTVHLILDPLLGESISARGAGRLQLVREEGELQMFGTLNVSGGEYLFSAGELFMRRLVLEQGGAITWDGRSEDPVLDLTATYRTLASTAGLFYSAGRPETLPLIVNLSVEGRLQAPQIQVDLAIDHASSAFSGQYAGLEALLNQPEHVAEYATSVLLTNSFLLTTSLAQAQNGGFTETRNQIAFTSLSQLVTGQLNRYLSEVIPNLRMNFGVQRRSSDQLGVSYGLALRLLDERLIIRGSGAYRNEETSSTRENLEGELVVEVRLHPNVAVQVYYRRKGELLESVLTNTTGAGLSYRTEFSTWEAFIRRVFGWL